MFRRERHAPHRSVSTLSVLRTGRTSPLGSRLPSVYVDSMEHALPFVIVIVMLATLGVLALGLVNLARGGPAKRSNKLMQFRVLLQGLALLLFLVFMWLFRR